MKRHYIEHIQFVLRFMISVTRYFFKLLLHPSGIFQPLLLHSNPLEAERIKER